MDESFKYYPPKYKHPIKTPMRSIRKAALDSHDMMTDAQSLEMLKRLSKPAPPPSLIAGTLIGVQPLTQPSSLIFYIRHKYSSNKGSTNEVTIREED